MKFKKIQPLKMMSHIKGNLPRAGALPRLGGPKKYKPLSEAQKIGLTQKAQSASPHYSTKYKRMTKSA